MRNFLLLFLLTVTFPIYAQNIIVNDPSAPESGLNAEELTLEVLIDGGECSSIENFVLKDNTSSSFPSQNRSWGYFEKGTSGFPFEKGIVLTSGRARDARGPNGPTSSEGTNSWVGDAMLNTISGFNTRNATVFEFDFIPFGNEISFNYIFASNEYEDDFGLGFECSGFNDVFAFVISGPGIVNDPGINGKNIALLPNGDPVTIDNVNDVAWCGDPTYFVHINDNSPPINYNGRTTPLAAYSEVIPGETYHIRLMVADAVDTQYDSAVFLEAGSFSLGSTLVDLEGAEIGENEMLCDMEEYTLVVNLEAPDAQFQWYLNYDEIPGATNQSYTATESGFYEVVVISGSCSTRVGVDLSFSQSPEAVNYEDFICNPEGSHIFDLTSYEFEISSTPGAIFDYYQSYDGALEENPLDLIPTPNSFEITEETIVYVRVKNESNCFTIIELTLNVGVGPDTQPATYPTCDDNGDGIAEFNLPSYNGDIVTSGVAGLAFEYYLDEDLTQIINAPANFENTTNPQIIYVKTFAEGAGEEDCISVEELTLIVNEFPDIQDWEETYCDNLNDASEIVDLTQNEIVITQGINVTLHYYPTLDDLENGTAEIMDPENYEVTGPTTEIYVQVESESGICRDYAVLTIILNPSPEVENAVLENCSIDGYSTYHLPDANGDIAGTATGLTITYHTTYNNAFSSQNSLPDDYENTVLNQIIYVRVENGNGCFSIAELLLTTVMVHESLNDIIEECDDPYMINDETAVFDLTAMDSNIETALGGTSYNISYYLTLENAQNGTNPITNPTEFENTSNPQTIYARASGGNGGCAGTAEFEIEVLPVPEFDLPQSAAFCNNGQDMIYQLNEDFASYTWTDPDGNIISTTAEVTFEQEGIHTLEVTEAGGSCPAIREIDVLMDMNPVITEIDVNGSTVTVYPGGATGPYEYSYNGGLTWHSHFVLTNVPPGVHTMLVRSLYGCISEGKIFGVLGIPNVITPNGDGYNDYMTIRGLELYPDANIKIFDRYGKIFIDRPMGTEFRWDGQYMGRPLPSGDYWYIITVEAGKSISGHISIRNR